MFFIKLFEIRNDENTQRISCLRSVRAKVMKSESCENFMFNIFKELVG